MELRDLLVEYADILSAPGFDFDHLQDHLQLLNDFMRSKSLSAEALELVNSCRMEIKRLSSDPYSVLLSSQNNLVDLVSRLDFHSKLLEAPNYLYHGTTYSRLQSIQEYGLVPGRGSAWSFDVELARRCSEAVFFADRWRIAASFAGITGQHSSGRRDGLARRPVVLRLSADYIKADRDESALQGGCWMVRGTVRVDNADVYIAPHRGLPSWQSLQYLL